MITGEIKSQIDQIWNAFWSGGISNPLEVIEQMTYLLFIKRLTQAGIMDPGPLYEAPFTGFHYEGLDGALGDSDATTLVGALTQVNARAAA